MAKENWIEIAVKYGGYMENDKEFLTNATSRMDEETALRYLCPPPSVINAYFSELYQKRSPEVATDYFLELSKVFGNFPENPAFGFEGKAGYENFRFIRLNVDGRSYGFSFLDSSGNAVIFSEFPNFFEYSKPGEILKFLFNISQIFPQYLIRSQDAELRLTPNFLDKADFTDEREISVLTNAAENEDFIKFYGYNREEVIDAVLKHGTFGDQLVQYKQKQFIVYVSKKGEIK